MGEFIRHEPCPKCGSRDNLARYDDMSAFCFGCQYHEQGDGSPQEIKRRSPLAKELLDPGEPTELKARGISAQTCRHFGYTKTRFKDEPVQVAAYRDKHGNVVAQKLRTPSKKFSVRGDLSEALPLWGQWLWNGGRRVVVTEGEIDCMSVSQMQGNRWPVVSVPSGAQGAAKSVRKALDWLLGFDEIVFCFDDDEPGRDAAVECAALLPPGRAKVAKIPGYKDANEALVAGHGDTIIPALWSAEAYRPDGIVQIEELFEEATKPIEYGLPWWHPDLTNATYGRRPGELYALGAGTGVGKTDFMTQQAAFDAVTLGEKVGMIYLEMPPVELSRRLAGKVAHRRFHVPGIEHPVEELKAAFDKLDGKVSIYDHFGETDWEVIANRVRYMVQAEGCRIIYIDHLTAMADPSDERASLEVIMKEMAGLAQELQVIVHFVSHLATPEGKPHEEGGRVTIRHFKGARAIGFWSYFMFGMERNQQDANESERQHTVFRILKDRYTGASTGRTFDLGYDIETGLLYPMETGEEDFGF